MESQINKNKIYMDNKEDNEKKKRNIGKKDSFKLPKETFEENDVIIINNVQDFEKDIKNYIEKMEKQLFNHHSLIALQRQKFKEILNKVAIILDQKEVNYESFQKFFQTLNLSSLLNQNKNKFHGKSNEINASLDGIFLEQLKEAETKINGDDICKEKNNSDNKSILLIESDTSCKNENNNETTKKEPKNLKRGRNPNSYNQDKQIKKRKIASNNKNGDDVQDQIDFNHLEEINHPQNFHNINNNNFNKITNGNNSNMPFNNFRLMGNYNNFIINDNMEKLNSHDNNYFLLAQKMMGANGNFLNSYNEILNNENMFSINKN